MRTLVPFTAVLLAASALACSKAAPPCDGLANADPPFCIPAPAAAFKQGNINRLEKGGSVSYMSNKPGDGMISIAWYLPDAYQHELTSGGYGASKKFNKPETTGKMSGVDGEWAQFTKSGAKTTISIIKTPKATIFCTGTAAGFSPLVEKVNDACKKIR